VAGALSRSLRGHDAGLLATASPSLPGGDRLEDLGYEPFNLGLHEADQLARVLDMVDSERDVAEIVNGLPCLRQPRRSGGRSDLCKSRSKDSLPFCSTKPREPSRRQRTRRAVGDRCAEASPLPEDSPRESLHRVLRGNGGRSLARPSRGSPALALLPGVAREDPTGERASKKIVGKTPAQANDEWIRWVERPTR